MKIDLLKDRIVLYLKKEYIGQIDYNNINELEKYFKKLFLKLYKIFDIKLYGIYTLNIYVDKYYGSVIEIIDEENEYTLNQIDMQINIIHNNFLYQIDNNVNDNKFEKYLYKNKIYLKIKNELKKIDMIKLLEFSKIIYDTEDIILCSKKV